MCPYEVSLNIKFEGSSWTINFRNAKMLNSHDQPLYAYLMRYDAHIQSHPRSSPKWYIYQKHWNPMKRIQVIIQTPTADRWTDGRTWWIQYTPLNFVAGGIIKYDHIVRHEDVCKTKSKEWKKMFSIMSKLQIHYHFKRHFCKKWTNIQGASA